MPATKKKAAAADQGHEPPRGHPVPPLAPGALPSLDRIGNIVRGLSRREETRSEPGVRTVVTSSLADGVGLEEEFVRFFSGAESNDGGPPRKKQKKENIEEVEADGPDLEYIVVKETAWVVKCGSSKIPRDGSFERDAQVTASWKSDTFEQLDILGDARESLFRAPLPTESAGINDIFLALLVHRKARKYKKGQVRLWTDCTVRLYNEEKQDCVQILFTVKWNVTASPWSLVDWRSNTPALQFILPVYFPDANICGTSSETAREFYKCVYSPGKDDQVAASLKTDVDTDLYPFQKRTVQWMLKREHVEWSGIEVVKYDPSSDRMPLSFIEARDGHGEKCYISHLFGVATKDPASFLAMENGINGGILAEEMGLGKTVEIISLMTLHKRPKEPLTVYDPYIGEDVRPTNATLIISPPSILEQWISEINRHAPQLKVVNYEGLKASKWEDPDTDFLEKLASADVVISTYAVLAEEIWYTKLNAEKTLRRAPKYPRPVSPLMQLSWWRVCIDEAQMIESGVSQAAVVARLIPRVNAWCVTGTPVRKDVNDLHGLLIFLRYEPYASSKQVWSSLITVQSSTFRTLFGTTALRHSKHNVRDELKLPPQRRYVITMPFTPVEEQHYRENFLEMCKESGLDTEGAPLSGDWTPEGAADTMRRWLVRLRQITLHPEVSRWSRRALGNKDGPLRTVDQVLDAMMEQTDTAIRQNQRSMLMAKLRRGQLLENSPRVKEALEIWSDVNTEATAIVEECRDEIRTEIIRLAEEAKTKPADNTVGAAWATRDAKDPNDDPNSRLGTFRNRLRNALEVQHMATFFMANAYFQIKSNEEWTEPESEEFKRLEELETRGYEAAKKLRNEILQDIIQKADKLMNTIAQKAASQAFAVIPEFSPKLPKGGIESHRILERLDEFAIAFDNQAEAIDEWREKTIQFLVKPLVDDGDDVEITGDEYEDSTKTQDEVMVYGLALRAITADRYQALSGIDNKLIEHDVSVALRLAKLDEGHCPQKIRELLGRRDELRPLKDLGSVRGIVAELRALQTSLSSDARKGSQRAANEMTLVLQQLQATQKQLAQHLKVAFDLEKENELFTTVINSRVEYYRQLQSVSDSVAPYTSPFGSPATQEARLKQEEEDYATKVAAARSKHRYLLHLKQEAENPQETRMCVICRDDNFEVGGLTVCGHQFCKDCITLWYNSHRRCPVCKRYLMAIEIHSITYKPQQLTVSTEITSSPTRFHSTTSRRNASIYTNISGAKLAAIKNIDLRGPSFGTKIDTLSRHLIWLRETDPGSKSIIFSQFTSFLTVLSQALSSHRIGFSSIDQSSGIQRFKNDPSVECFLLHAKAHSSGLNLVNASHVFLCEPLLNTALELQAVARVDRIGQRAETCVWLYLVDGTVEQSVHALSVTRRLEHMGRRVRRRDSSPAATAGALVAESDDDVSGDTVNRERISRASSTDSLLDSTIEMANSMELQEASLKKLLVDKGVGEVVQQGDLWECLFGGGGVSGGWNERGDRGGGDGRGGGGGRIGESAVRDDPAVRGFLAAGAAEERRVVARDGLRQ